jgi:hypothetical protein
MTPHLRWGILATGWIAGQMTADLQVAGIPVTAVGSRTLDEVRRPIGVSFPGE